METLLIILILINFISLMVLVFTYVIFLLNSMFPEKYFKKDKKKKNFENIRLQYFNDNISYQGVIYKVNSEEYLSIRVLQDGTFTNYRIYGNKKRNLRIYQEQI